MYRCVRSDCLTSIKDLANLQVLQLLTGENQSIYNHFYSNYVHQTCIIVFSVVSGHHHKAPGVSKREGRSLWKISFSIHIQYNTIQLYCLCVEKFAFWLIIYIKTFNTVNNKTSTTQWNTELKTAQIQGKYLTVTMYTHACTHTHTHAHMHAHMHTHTHTYTHYSSGSPIT